MMFQNSAKKDQTDPTPKKNNLAIKKGGILC
jgi:hypothetical protein